MPHRALTEPWWTPWPGTGPGHDLLGDLTGLTLLELGCGNGNNAAAFAAAGADVTGIDHDPARIEHARSRWVDTPRLRLEHADAATYLASLQAPVDVVCSIFGAFSFTPPEPLLDQIIDRLRPGGRLALAARTPGKATPRGCQAARWQPHVRTVNAWQNLLAERGLHLVTAQLLDHPTDVDDAPGSMVLVARLEPDPRPAEGPISDVER